MESYYIIIITIITCITPQGSTIYIATAYIQRHKTGTNTVRILKHAKTTGVENNVKLHVTALSKTCCRHDLHTTVRWTLTRINALLLAK